MLIVCTPSGRGNLEDPSWIYTFFSCCITLGPYLSTILLISLDQLLFFVPWRCYNILGLEVFISLLPFFLYKGIITENFFAFKKQEKINRNLKFE